MTPLTKTLTTLRQLGFLTIALTLALIANFAYGAWSNPTEAPTGGNVSAPVHIGTGTQWKQGSLIVNGFSLTSTAPTMYFEDTSTNERDYWWHVNQNFMYLLHDRNSDGSWSGDSPWPLQIFAGVDVNNDYALFSNQVRATEYCDATGANCIDPNNPGTGTGGGDGQGIANTVWSSAPTGISAWPDWFTCTINSGDNTAFTFVNREATYADQQTSDPRTVRFNEAGQNNNANTANEWGTCGSIQEICQAGNCGFFSGGAPAVTSVPPTLPPPPPSCNAQCACEAGGGVWSGGEAGCSYLTGNSGGGG